MTGSIFGSHPVDRYLARGEAAENAGPPAVGCARCAAMVDGDEVDDRGLCAECLDELEKEKKDE